ncbi:glycoside hydrolase family 47 protein [Aplosporella prunicola CBS 121167]|uniref:alpha-1,2-Mannosidase n=1 Tax=Aplosporella prunicola CBS 121167 TaxID=1176127 RepID=A0A6A6B532_9PEZI|nr:glycoside hydrolase family 47 protein [Aplosporella prunicola CBS 121167]KAF2138324.1 glycoside hydrolase family 47 protein [Aplosporella prunicola CBS 121167]
MLSFWPARTPTIAALLLGWLTLAQCMSHAAIEDLKRETTDIFYHGYENYMRHAFPEDELRPLSCTPLTRDRANPAHIEVNDVLGNYSLTLIDSLSTLAILASSPPDPTGRKRPLEDFQNGIELLVEHYGDGTEGPGGEGKRARGFDLDSKVQVFETVIRGVGGLLSAHLFAVGDLPINGYKPEVKFTEDGNEEITWPSGFVYDGQLLRLAYDLANRILPAFHTATGLPYPRVNLRSGIPFYVNSPLNADSEHGQCYRSSNAPPEITETCSAGAGSLVLEFSTLSRLTGDDRFEKAAKRAFWAVWSRRSISGLIGSGIDAETGQWVSPYTGIGAGIDSFFEYAFKSHILLSGLPYEAANESIDSPEAFLMTWQDAHAGISRHIYRGAMHQHPHYIQVDLYTGAMRAFWIDSLSAYYPGLLTMAGELDEAIETHLLYTALWTRYSALPERWSTATGNIEQGLRWWGGRPEFIESSWYLYRATKDPWYLHVGEMTLRDIKRRCWTKCGWAGLQDVRTGELSDRMESFFLGETAKYLFLLFDSGHPLNHIDAPWVFTTEGHPLIIPDKLRRKNNLKPRRQNKDQEEFDFINDSVCPLPPPHVPFSISATAARSDIFHAASLARLHLMPNRETMDSPLVEFNVDHPSISVADLKSPSNYTYYPWTLPPSLIPYNATSSRMVARTTFDLSFPNLPNNNMLSTGSLQRIGGGVLVNSMSGLRLGMVREPEDVPAMDESTGNSFRIYAVSNVALGRDEKVFMSRDIVTSFNPADPYFTRTRDLSMLDLFLDIPEPVGKPGSSEPDYEDEHNDTFDDLAVNTDTISILDLSDDIDLNLAANDPSLISSLLSNLQAMLTETLEPLTRPSSKPPRRKDDASRPRIRRVQLSAALSTGPGSAPLPNSADGSWARDSASASAVADTPHLPWRSIYMGDDNCGTKLPASVPRDHQVLVLRRGGCSFSQKLQNIPAHAPAPGSLKLVIVVSFPEHEGLAHGQLVQPHLERVQELADGVPRPHPIPLVMVSGGEETWALLRRGAGVGARRRWWFESQGLRIGNLIVV